MHSWRCQRTFVEHLTATVADKLRVILTYVVYLTKVDVIAVPSATATVRSTNKLQDLAQRMQRQ
jgi:hypothetical protein